MLLRSSSTPVLGSLLSSTSPSRDFDHTKRFSPINDLGHKRNSISNSGQSNFDRKPRLRSSSLGFRRAQSDGNLEGLAAAASEIDGVFDLDQQDQQNPSRGSVLETIPSFSMYNCVGEDECEVGIEESGLERSVTIGETIGEVGFGLGGNLDLSLIKEEEESEPVSPPLYLARGLGIDSGLGGGGNGGRGGFFKFVKFGDGGQDGSGMEEHYKRLIEENPGNPLFLRNYAQFLYQSKGDLHKAEELYSRAILLDPGDGEMLSQYAKLIWELHHDHERAYNYFERSVQLAPQDCHVHAAYAHFLWETEDENEEDLSREPFGAPVLHGVAGVTLTSA
ncbi:hypothetical protein Syun_030057 [Stephania yunnanensis]|uniref:TmcB/TmcC TPR repeats domain-containing protein n=1 Tax=Stephania yunnanensis TaxID=152371 RepID=A0AAP0E9R7_9MAGN